MGLMESPGPPSAPTRLSLVSARLIVRPVPWDAVLAITGGERLDDWAPDYPGDGDVVIARLLQDTGRDGGRGAGREVGQARAGDAIGPVAGPSGAGPSGAEPGDEAWGHRQVVERASGLVVGGIGFFGPPLDAEVEIGYGIVPSRQGRGYATEALLAMIAMAWADARVRSVGAGTDPGNVASQRVLGKAGFSRIAGRITGSGEFRYELARPARG